MVELPIPGAYGHLLNRRCKIIEISEPGADFWRDSTIEWLDSGERDSKRWKAARGVNQPVWVVAGTKMNAALRHEADVERIELTGRWIWRGYRETVGV